MSRGGSGDEVTRLIEALQAGQEPDLNRLVELMYRELLAIAESKMRGQPESHLLQPEALLHEAFIRLVRGKHAAYQNREHFLAVASTVMRQVLVDHARRSHRKSPTGRHRVPLESIVASLDQRGINILTLDEALEQLSRIDHELAQVVELRVLAGLTASESARLIGVSTRTLERRWSLARKWLQGILQDEAEGSRAIEHQSVTEAETARAVAYVCSQLGTTPWTEIVRSVFAELGSSPGVEFTLPVLVDVARRTGFKWQDFHTAVEVLARGRPVFLERAFVHCYDRDHEITMEEVVDRLRASLESTSSSHSSWHEWSEAIKVVWRLPAVRKYST